MTDQPAKSNNSAVTLAPDCWAISSSERAFCCPPDCSMTLWPISRLRPRRPACCCSSAGLSLALAHPCSQHSQAALTGACAVDRCPAALCRRAHRRRCWRQASRIAIGAARRSPLSVQPYSHRRRPQPWACWCHRTSVQAPLPSSSLAGPPLPLRAFRWARCSPDALGWRMVYGMMAGLSVLAALGCLVHPEAKALSPHH